MSPTRNASAATGSEATGMSAEITAVNFGVMFLGYNDAAAGNGVVVCREASVASTRKSGEKTAGVSEASIGLAGGVHTTSDAA